MLINRAFAVTLLLSAVAPVLGAADTPTTAPAASAVNLHRPMKPGEIYDVHLVYEKKSDYKRTDRPQAPDPMNKLAQVDLAGQISKVVPDDNHDPKQFTLTIRHLLSQGRDSIRPGTALTIALSNQKIEYTDPMGARVPDNARPLLDYVINGYFVCTQLNNALGSPKAVSLNASWRPDPTPLAGFLSDDTPVAFKPFNVKGTAKISKAPDSAPALPPGTRHLTASVECKDFTFEQASKGMIAEGSTGTYQYSALVPADDQTPLLEEERIFDAVTRYTTASDRIRVQWNLHRSLKTTIALVKPASGTASAAPASPVDGAHLGKPN